jgi:hypothetical protein
MVGRCFQFQRRPGVYLPKRALPWFTQLPFIRTVANFAILELRRYPNILLAYSNQLPQAREKPCFNHVRIITFATR